MSRAGCACKAAGSAKQAARALVLVDAVRRNAATLAAATRALISAGAAHLDVRVFARLVALPHVPI